MKREKPGNAWNQYVGTRLEKEIRDGVLEVFRLEGELKRLGPEFAEDGIVKTVLRERVRQEKTRVDLMRTNKKK